jgi:hypothetical protein
VRLCKSHNYEKNKKEVAMDNKKIAAIVVFGLAIMGLTAQTPEKAKAVYNSTTSEKLYSQGSPENVLDLIEGEQEDVLELVKIQQEKLLEIEAEKQRQKMIKENRLLLEIRVSELKKYVNKTWYVFSGSTPRGWDCSGLTLWFYRDLGVELEHSATKQALYAGFHVDYPKVGDLVAFRHYNAEKYYHIGIYVGNNEIIHARRKGTLTELVSLSDEKFKKSEITFVRILEN